VFQSPAGNARCATMLATSLEEIGAQASDGLVEREIPDTLALLRCDQVVPTVRRCYRSLMDASGEAAATRRQREHDVIESHRTLLVTDSARRKSTCTFC
jgi:hypothetical protein